MPQTDAPAWEDTEAIPSWDETRPLLSDSEMGQIATNPPMQFLPGGMNEPGTKEQRLAEVPAIVGSVISAPGAAIDAVLPRAVSDFAFKPLVNPQTSPSDLAFRKAHPIIGGTEAAVVDLAKSFTSPVGIATLGMGTLPQAAQKAISLTFAAQMASSMPELAGQIIDTWNEPDSPDRTLKLTHLIGTAAGTGYFTKHALESGLRPRTMTPAEAAANRVAVEASLPPRMKIAPPRFEDTTPIPEANAASTEQPISAAPVKKTKEQFLQERQNRAKAIEELGKVAEELKADYSGVMSQDQALNYATDEYLKHIEELAAGAREATIDIFRRQQAGEPLTEVEQKHFETSQQAIIKRATQIREFQIEQNRSRNKSESQPTEVSNASSQQSAAPPDGGVRTRSEVGQLPEGNVEAADARLRGNEGEVPANLPPQEGALGRGGAGQASEEKAPDLSKEASNVEKGAEIEKQDHRIARENPEIAREIAQEEIDLDPNAYKGDEVKSVLSPPETLVQAAFRLPTGKILKVGAFHDASKLPKKYLDDPSDPMTDYAGEVEPGWVTSTGRFVGREEATTVGKQSGQVPESYNYPAHHRVVKLPESVKPPPENRVKTGDTESTPPATSAGVETKQPWQMTKQEFLDSVLSPEGQRLRKKSIGNLTLKQWRQQEHEVAVAQALSEGKPVPPEVLADYPDLAKSAPQPSTQSQGPGTTAGEKPTTPVVGEQKPPLSPETKPPELMTPDEWLAYKPYLGASAWIDHQAVIANAIQSKRPVSAAALEPHDGAPSLVKFAEDKGYVREGDRYVFKPKANVHKSSPYPPDTVRESGQVLQQRPTKPGGGLSTRTAEEQAKSAANNSLKAMAEANGVTFVEGDTPESLMAKINAKAETVEPSEITIESVNKKIEANEKLTMDELAFLEDYQNKHHKIFEVHWTENGIEYKSIFGTGGSANALANELKARRRGGEKIHSISIKDVTTKPTEPPPSPAGAGEKVSKVRAKSAQTELEAADNAAGKASNEAEKAVVAWARHVEDVVNPLKEKIRKIQSEVGQMQYDAQRTKPETKGKQHLTKKKFLEQYGVASMEEANALYKQKNAEWADLEKQLEAAESKRKELEVIKERRGKEWSSAATRAGELRRQVYPKVREGDVGQPTPPPSEPPSGGEGEFPVGPGTGEGPGSPHRSEVETGSGADIYGIAQRVREERAKAGQTVEVLPGKGIGAEAAVNRGRQLLSEGYDVEKALSDFEQTGAASADLVMAARAQGEILFRNARRIEEKFGTESPEFRAAFDAASRWDVRTKPLGTEAHKQFMAHQGETDIDTGSFTGIRRAYADAHDGQDLPTSKRQRAKEIAAEVYRANAEVDKANKDLIDAADKAHGADQQSYVNHFANELDKLAYQIIEAKPDISRDDLIKEIRGDLSGNYVDLAPEQVEDALSGYGKSYGPSKDPIRLKLTGYKGEMRERGKLRSMAEGEAPKRTGLQRAPATPEERALRKQVEAEKRRGGYNITDPETQLRTALQAAKTRAENAIVDLEREIANRERAVKSKPNTPTDSELEALKKKLAETRDRHAKLFGDLDLATLRQRFAGKTDAEFSPEDARAIWQTIKSRYLNQGVTDLDTVAVNAAKDLGLTPAQVIRAVVSDRGVKRMADDLWNKQAKQRLLQSEARAWVRYNDAPALLKFARMVPRFFFALKVAGHGFVWPGTHTAIHVVSPRSWGEFFPQYFASWRNVFSKGEHERYLREIQNDPLYTLTRRAGLEVDVERSVNEFANPDQAKFFRRFGSAGNRAFDSLKGLRLELFKDRWEKVPQEVRSDPKQNMAAAEALADWINHSTGALHGSTPVARALKSESLRAISFAPTLYGSRFATIGDVGRALTGFKKSATPAERFVSRQIAADAAATLGTFAGLLLINNAFLASTGSKDRVNFTDPTKPDFLAFKLGGGSYVGVGSGFVAISRLAAHLVAALYEQKKGQSSAYRTWDKLGSHILQYGRGLLAPWLSTALTAMLGFDYFKRPLPPSVQWLRKESAGLPPPKPGKNAPQLGEFQYYASEFSPIPVSEGVQVFYEDLRKNGLNHDQAIAVLRAVATGVFSGTTGFRVGEIAPDKQPEIKSPYPKLPTLPKLPKFNYVPTPQPSTNSITR